MKKKVTNAAELRDAKQQRKTVAEQLASNNKPDMTPEEVRAWDELKADYDAWDAAIVDYEAFQERQAALSGLQSQVGEERGQATATATAKKGPVVQVLDSRQNLRVFRNLGEQLIAVREAAFGHKQVDERLLQLNNEARALGGNEGIGADGGFAVQTDFAGVMMNTAVETGDILSRVDTYEVSNPSNGVKWVDIDEDDVSTTVFGGVQLYWRAEAAAVTASKPKLDEVKIDLESLMGVAYTTEELMQDTVFMSQLYNRAFTTGIQRKLEGDIVDGDGLGKPKGILQSGSLVVVSKEGAQAADSIVFENIAHMWGRLGTKARRNAVWLMHPDLEEILPFMHLPVGTGGVPVYLPPSGAAGSSLATLYGKPIIATDHCSAIGDQGDVILGDLKEYFLAVKGGVQSAASIHVAFLTGENCYRFMFRANGRTKKNKQLTIKNSANKRSAFVTLQAR